LCAAAGVAAACSTFCIDSPNGPVFGKNYDWDLADGLVVVNKRNVAKTALTPDFPARWTSKHGSVTFNQYGRGMPCGGINEAGLVIEIMWLDESRYPAVDERASVPELQWIQYHLDTSSSVEEVIAGDGDIRISSDSRARVHFLVTDATGACASVEFLDGKTVVHTGGDMPAKALTNDTYANSAAYLGLHRGFGGQAPVRRTRGSLDRFVRAAAGAGSFDVNGEEEAVDYAFGILSSVAQGEYTKWSIVYDVPAGRVYFRTLDSPKIRFFDLGRFDFSCDSPVLILDVNGGFEGDVAGKFVPYSPEANLALVESATQQTDFLKDTPAWVTKALAQYPESTRCRP
jgi:choloylglycine hydrolase